MPIQAPELSPATGGAVPPLPRFLRTFTRAGIEAVERNYNGTHGVHRRVMLAMLAQNSRQLLRAVCSMAETDDGAAALGEMFGALDAFEHHLQEGLALVQSARARLDCCCDYLVATDGALPDEVKRGAQ